MAQIEIIACCTAYAFIVQWFAFVPSYKCRSERFYDLTGSLTYLSTVGLALLLSGQWSPRHGLVAGLVVLWSSRLGLFLFVRVKRDGGDRRFDTIKTHAGRFFIAWTLQGLWVVLTLSAALIVLTGPSPSPLGPTDALGAAIWLGGFGIEVIADRQKRRFREDPTNRGSFITTGLWRHSRHPNYLGEIVLWIGMAVLCSSTFTGWQWVGWISPLFVAGLLRFGSGIPILELRADQKWGDDPAYQRYKASTPVLVPRLLPR